MALFLVAGLTFSYGLGHAPPPRVCTAHATSVPAGLADAAAAQHAGAPATGPLAASGAAAFSEPVHLPPMGPNDACLSLAVLLALLVLSVAAHPGPTGARRPRRSGWFLAPPALPAPLARSLSCLQVLRL
ncbi:hypothetical protein [Actinomadura rugatobispora]|nr:hypothetical protein GCM10010200_086710 [Actinomadura rugatobispora]